MNFNVYKTGTPTCPHCLHAMLPDDMLAQDVDVFAMAPQEERHPLKCPACDKEFWCEGGYSPHYTSAFSEEELQ